MSQDNSNPALLLVDTSEDPSVSPRVPVDEPALTGHQILNQVHQELQFLPSTNHNVFVSGNLQDQAGKSSSASAMGTMGSSNPSADTEFLISSKHMDSTTISLDSPDSGSQPLQQKKYSIWQNEFYAQYFNLNSDVFFRRVIWSSLPLTGGNKGTFIERYIQSAPDLYGPFWLSLTLIFTISVCSDTLAHFDYAPASGNSTTPTVPRKPLGFHFSKVHLAALITFSYISISPLLIWSFCQWRRCARLYSFFECLCAYGYSIAIFIPATVLSMVNIRQLQFILFASAAFLSGSVLLISFAPVVHSDPSRSIKFSYLMLIFILGAHFILALIYLYLFL